MEILVALERLLSEFLSLKNSDADNHVIVHMLNNDVFHWYGAILGPESTPYEGGYFLYHIEFPQDYPSSPPDFYFITPMFHPNIRSDGRVCCEVFTTERWQSTISVRAIFSYIIGLLNEPRPQAGYIGEATELCETNKAAYNQKVREYTDNYGNLKWIKSLNSEDKEIADTIET
ncbi:unnamed protein product [Blepharisma stoltei]|uniref:UBC core domain-containing protein n=1 Tax=Blepharisma stoltei TaxID=1481888 RepID=A0AAU9I8B6_9CILI|nr:unnamed protein product [Blepharisma stoltei]